MLIKPIKITNIENIQKPSQINKQNPNIPNSNSLRQPINRTDIKHIKFI